MSCLLKSELLTVTSLSPLSNRQTLMEAKSCQVTLSGVDPSKWIKLNPGTVGVYRTRYSDALLDLLKQGIAQGQLPPRDRLGLQNDLFAFSKAGS